MSIRSRIRQFLAFIIRSVLWSVHIGLFFYTLLIYYLIGWLPTEHWFASLLMISLPLAWVGLVLVGALWLFFRPWRALLSVAGLLLGYWLWPRTLTFNVPPADTPTAATIQVLSFNVAGFGLGESPDPDHQTDKTKRVLNWTLRHPAQVKCFQEFVSNSWKPASQVRERLRAAGYVHEAILHVSGTSAGGVATFSKYPIVKKGRVAFGTSNGFVWADINAGTDTIRVVNVHLQSMGIRVRRVFEQDEMQGVKSETRTVLGALKYGFIARRNEIDDIERVVRSSPYPVIVTGDFNDTPYSLVYERLRRQLSNAFEEAGNGFGFTLNRAPRFIRIDNQFFTPSLKATHFKVRHDMPDSDHFPIEGTYVVASDKP